MTKISNQDFSMKEKTLDNLNKERNLLKEEGIIQVDRKVLNSQENQKNKKKSPMKNLPSKMIKNHQKQKKNQKLSKWKKTNRCKNQDFNPP